MKTLATITWLAEPHAFKTAFFREVAKAAGSGRALPAWPLSFRGFPETGERAQDCLARAKKQPKGALGRWLKLAFLKGRYNWSRRWFMRHPGHIALCWQGLTGTRRATMEGARDAGAARLFAELAPLPGRLTLDPAGVNAESSVPREAAAYDAVLADHSLLKTLKDGFQARVPRRKDVGQGAGEFDPGQPFLFVPLQVPDDSQMILFSDWVGGVSGFIDALAEAAQALPEGWVLRLKEHPSSKVAFTDQINALIARGARMRLDNESDSFAQIRASRGVVNVNSSMGLQAMFFDKPVIVTGQAFYDIPGLCDAARSLDGLKALFAGAEQLGFNADLRARVLTWLARDYYIAVENDRVLDPEHLRRRIGEAQDMAREGRA